MTYQSPGVYIEEVPSGPQPIAAASTSVVAVLGTTRKGPLQEPTRVTSWSDFVRVFGEATSRSFTAESVFGFFENGGPAAFIVRVDPSSPARWSARDIAGELSFPIAASSPGAWANDLSISIARDANGGKGSFFRSTLTGAATVTTGTEFTVPLASTAGLHVGDPVTAAPLATGGAEPLPRNGSVTNIAGTTATVEFGAAVTLPAGTVLSSSVGTTTTLHLPAGKGFKSGDVIVITAPDGTRTGANVVTAVENGSAVTLTLEAGPTAVPGAALAQRRVTIDVIVTPAGTPSGPIPSMTVAPSALTFPGTTTKPANTLFAGGDKRGPATITFADGRTATFSGPTFPVSGPTTPSGQAQLSYGLFAELFKQSGLEIATQASPAGDAANDTAIAAALGWVPEGTKITLSGAGAATITVTRNGPGDPLKFAITTGTPTAGGTYTDAQVITDATAVNRLVVRVPAAPRIGDVILIGTNYIPLTGVTPNGGDSYVISWATAVNASTFTAHQPIFAIENASVATERFTVAASLGTTTETFAGLSLNKSHPAYFAKDGVINGVSSLITVGERPAAADPIAFATLPYFTAFTTPGADAAGVTTEDYRKGLEQLEAETEPAMVIVPDAVRLEDPLLHADLVGKVVTHCEKFRRFAIIDAPNTIGESPDQDVLDWRNNTVNSTYAAVYSPHLKIVTIDPTSIERYTTVPPSGFVAGVFARTDRERGVHKAPGNERVSGAVGLAQLYTQRRQDPLNDGGVNLIRAFPGRGTRIWGARNATDDVTWRYVNVRRLFNMIETSVERNTQWVVFEPNTASTWIRVKVAVENFLDQQWRAGALAGTTPEQAYRVRVGLGETMTETDIDLGLVVTEVAIAPAKPAEFVVFRFSHKRLSE